MHVKANGVLYAEELPVITRDRFVDMMYGVHEWDIFLTKPDQYESKSDLEAIIFIYDPKTQFFYAVAVTFGLMSLGKITCGDSGYTDISDKKPDVRYYLKPYRFEIYGAFLEIIRTDASSTLLPMQGVALRQSFTDLVKDNKTFIEYWSSKLKLRFEHANSILHEPEVLGKYYYGDIPVHCQRIIVDTVLLKSNICQFLGSSKSTDATPEEVKLLKFRSRRLFHNKVMGSMECTISGFRSSARDRKLRFKEDAKQRDEIIRLANVISETAGRLSFENRRD